MRLTLTVGVHPENRLRNRHSFIIPCKRFPPLCLNVVIRRKETSKRNGLIIKCLTRQEALQLIQLTFRNSDGASAYNVTCIVACAPSNHYPMELVSQSKNAVFMCKMQEINEKPKPLTKRPSRLLNWLFWCSFRKSSYICMIDYEVRLFPLIEMNSCLS